MVLVTVKSTDKWRKKKKTLIYQQREHKRLMRIVPKERKTPDKYKTLFNGIGALEVSIKSYLCRTCKGEFMIDKVHGLSRQNFTFGLLQNVMLLSKRIR